MIDSKFLGKGDNRDNYTGSGFQMRMDFYSLIRDSDFKSEAYLKDMSRMYDGIAQHCHLIEKMGFDNTQYHEELKLVKDYMRHLRESYHPDLDLDEFMEKHKFEASEIDYPEDFDPPKEEPTFIDDLDWDVMEL
ncbi:RNA methyltransferase [Fusibacter tunisiensis]|uniref:Uncharacterized protein n=1 Tax=Fusibacter tunisiensis TaxID=1008308 RepID=A0ABS2MTV7_9FIRM|nr:hypothetical protein [Fusibacter tunisiensis]MBM7562849.1 hypothetical protein [Fusibacter tunisiensis]